MAGNEFYGTTTPKAKSVLNDNAELTSLNNISVTFGLGTEVFGNFLFFGGVTPRFAIYDISDPANILLVSSDSPALFPFGFAISGNTCIVISNTAFAVYDITELANPVLLITVQTPSGGYKGYIRGINFYQVKTGASGALSIYDLSDPSAPILRSTTSVPDAAVLGGSFTMNNICYVCGEKNGDLTLIDISDPDAPVIIGTTSFGAFSERGTNNCQGYGRLLFFPTLTVSDSLYHLHIIDISDPGTPVLLSTIDNGTGQFFNPFILQPPYLYIAGGNSRKVYEISSPNTPALIWSRAAPTGTGNPLALALTGNIEVGSNLNSIFIVGIDGFDEFSASFANIQVGRLTVLNDALFTGKQTVLGSMDIREELVAGADISAKKNLQAENQVVAYRDRPTVRYGLIIGGGG